MSYQPDHRLLLTVVINATGTHPRSWLHHPDPGAFVQLEHYLRLARTAHEGTFDAIWLPDAAHIGAPASTHFASLDPFVLLTALATQVPDIGLVPTFSTSYRNPYEVARMVTSLDQVSGGRAGFNAVTSVNRDEARNFGQDGPEAYATRYARADEFLTVLTKLHRSWPLTDFEALRARGLCYDAEVTRPVDHHGEHFQVRGPLNVPQAQPGGPLVGVAGGSDHAQQLAVTHADAFYTALVNREAAIEFSHGLRARAGRPVRVMPGLAPIVGSTTEEANRLLDEAAADYGFSLDPVDRVSELLQIDPSRLHPDRPVPAELLARPPAQWSRPLGFWTAIVDAVQREQLLVRQIARRFQVFTGHHVVVGTPDHIADYIIDWWARGAVDGFAILSLFNFRDIPTFVDEVVPVLRQRGVFPSGYRKEGLRQRFGIPQALEQDRQ
ncbi:NtaA/DmoA family FMN-dependent monooxygenase [Micromonospora zingiberis]|uniref:NtaA/DmoA family FMN-dependent monooxygenase n=1 Tax=Micromonospora zingiberis TaxID=2053011 RepID=UPI0013F41ACB|nr:NtaA/DmoA family FMN-dependent monooxygenase [Micromonospora zingiberis]